jgi:zinc transporter ZupT
MRTSLQLVTFGLLAASGNLLGGWLLTVFSPARRERLQPLVALGAGFMLATVFLDVFPTIGALSRFTEKHSFNSPTVWVLIGYLLIQLVEHTIAPHFHFGEETHSETMRQSGVALTAVIALAIHAFFDGVAIATGLLTNFKLGVLLFIAVLLHKIPEGLTVASIMYSAGRGTTAAFRASAVVAAATFAGITLVMQLQDKLAVLLPLSAGVTLFVAASDLIPEVNRTGGWRNSLPVFVGVALFLAVHWLLETAL